MDREKYYDEEKMEKSMFFMFFNKSLLILYTTLIHLDHSFLAALKDILYNLLG